MRTPDASSIQKSGWLNLSPEDAQAWLASIVSNSDDAIVSKDLNGVVRSWNDAATRIFGYGPEEMIGRPIAILVPPERDGEEASILARLCRGERIDHFETVRMRKDGQRINVSVTISPIADRSGNVIGASKIARDITTLKRVMEEREHLLESERAARQDAERANRVKDEFLATLSHELRSPLNAILGWAHLLLEGEGTPEDLPKGLETIERCARAQSQLIEDLLDVSRIISGKMALKVQPVELGAIVNAAIASVQPAADAKGVHLGQRVDTEADTVMGDPARLQQIIWNLLTNAVKFTPRGGHVHIRLRRAGEHVEIIVKDTGQGIDPEFLPRVFARFSQADASTTRKHSGLGLGLAIVRHLAELHGGTAHAESPGVGRGATFTVTLPLIVPPQSDAPPADTPRPLEAAPRATARRFDFSNIKVLVVDDDADARVLMKRVLESNSATVITAASAEEALGLVQTERPSLLISDIGMPGEDGYQLIAKVRQLPPSGGGQTPAVALTAFARSEDRSRALLAGFQMHVPKPVEPAEILAVVASMFRARQ